MKAFQCDGSVQKNSWRFLCQNSSWTKNLIIFNKEQGFRAEAEQ